LTVISEIYGIRPITGFASIDMNLELEKTILVNHLLLLLAAADDD